MAINAGKMNQRIVIEKRTLEYVKGMKNETWNYYYDCSAELLDLFGQEKYAAFNAHMENSVKFRCRYCNLMKVLLLDTKSQGTKDYRVVWNNEPYNLDFVDGCNGSKTEIVLQVNRVS